jgi:alpha-L-fucosidase
MQSWGYRKNEDYYTDRYLMMSIDSYLSREANYLLNVGPDEKGSIPEESKDILLRIGKWFRDTEEAYNDVELMGSIGNKDILITGRDNILYVHLNKLPKGNTVGLFPLKTLPEKTTLLNTKHSLKCVVERKPYEKEEYLWIQDIPVNEYPNEIMIIKLEFNKSVKQLKQ